MALPAIALQSNFFMYLKRELERLWELWNDKFS